MTLTTQQAADLLGVSRPTVVRLINDNALAAERIGNRHRLLLDHVLAYREERRKRQYAALAATAIDIESDDDPEMIRKQLREARRVVAARRRKAAQRSGLGSGAGEVVHTKIVDEANDVYVPPSR